MSPLPSRFAPMLAAPAGTLPEQLAGWTIEPKWDGVRVIAEVTARGARLWTRNGNDKAPQFPEIVDALIALAAEHGPFVLDGEIVALDAQGRALRFQALQGRMHAESEETRARNAKATRTALVAFDLLVDDGRLAHRAAVDRATQGARGARAGATRRRRAARRVGALR